LISILGFVSLLFGADMVVEHQGKVNFLLTGVSLADSETLQSMRIRNMVVMSLAFVGAFLWSAQSILHRLNAGDLAPSIYFSAGIRMILAPILSLMLSHLIHGFETLQALQPGLPVIAFLTGWFPSRVLIFLKEQFPLLFPRRRSADALPLNMIEGIHTYDRARLVELGIVDAQNLANGNFIELVVRTAFNPAQIIDWIGQARLYVYFKDEVTLLRKYQIRTVFDMLPVCEDRQCMERLAAVTRLDPLGFQMFCNKLLDDPVIKQLLGFQKRLCFAPQSQGRENELRNVIETDFAQRNLSKQGGESGHG
jgi:hypothetical protein